MDPKKFSKSAAEKYLNTLQGCCAFFPNPLPPHRFHFFRLVFASGVSRHDQDSHNSSQPDLSGCVPHSHGRACVKNKSLYMQPVMIYKVSSRR